MSILMAGMTMRMTTIMLATRVIPAMLIPTATLM